MIEERKKGFTVTHILHMQYNEGWAGKTAVTVGVLDTERFRCCSVGILRESG